MRGETNLSRLIQHMQPQLNEGVYVFCHLPADQGIPIAKVLASFREKEGLSIILPKSEADHFGLSYPFEAAWITLNIHSALDAVGLTAAVAKALAQKGISCNVVAAFYHDHIFVEKDKANEALAALEELSRQDN
jgi:hypothetical protein